MKTNKYDFLAPISDLFIGYCSGLGTLEAGHLVGIVNEMKTLTRHQLAGADTDEIYDIVFTVIPAIKKMISEAIDPYDEEETYTRERTRAEIKLIENAADDYQRWLCECTIKTTLKDSQALSNSFTVEVNYKGALLIVIAEPITGSTAVKVWCPGVCDMVISTKPNGAWYTSQGLGAGYGLVKAIGKALRLLTGE